MDSVVKGDVSDVNLDIYIYIYIFKSTYNIVYLRICLFYLDEVYIVISIF